MSSARVSRRWSTIPVRRFGIVLSLLLATVIGACAKLNVQDDWTLYALHGLECDAARAAARTGCESGSIGQAQCAINQLSVELSEECVTRRQIFQRLLAVRHEKAWALYREWCAQGSPEAGCPAEPEKNYETANLTYARHLLDRANAGLAAIQQFDARRVAGFEAAGWGTAPQGTAKAIVETIKRGDQGWDAVRNVALGRPAPSALSFTDAEGTTWTFSFGDGSEGLIGYSQVFRMKRIDDVLLRCRERFGRPVKEEADRLAWFGSKTNVFCRRSVNGWPEIAIERVKVIPPPTGSVASTVP